MKKVILAIGVPGSGKTTVLKNFAQNYHYAYLSADELRIEMNIAPNNPLISSDNPMTQGMWDEMRHRLAQYLKEGKTVVVDATFTRADLRQEFVELAKRNGAQKVQGVFVDTPSELAWERNEQRDRKAPREVFDKRVHDLRENPPSLEDGFDSVFRLDEYQKLLQTEVAKPVFELKNR